MPEVKICDVTLRDGMQAVNRDAVLPLAPAVRIVDLLGAGTAVAHSPTLILGGMLDVTVEYIPDKDVLLGHVPEGAYCFVPFCAGKGILLYPTDAHAPMHAVDEPVPVRRKPWPRSPVRGSCSW